MRMENYTRCFDVEDLFGDEKLAKMLIRYYKGWRMRWYSSDNAIRELGCEVCKQTLRSYMEDESYADPSLEQSITDPDKLHKYLKFALDDNLTEFINLNIYGRRDETSTVRISDYGFTATITTDNKCSVFTLSGFEMTTLRWFKDRKFPIKMLSAFVTFCNESKNYKGSIARWVEKGIVEKMVNKDTKLNELNETTIKAMIDAKCEERNIPFRVEFTTSTVRVFFRFGDHNYMRFMTKKANILNEIDGFLDDVDKVRDVYANLSYPTTFGNEPGNFHKVWKTSWD